MSTFSQGWVANGGQSAAPLSLSRPHDETVIKLGPVLNASGNLAQIDRILGGQAIRTSAFMAQSRFYWQLPYYRQDPGRHHSWGMLLRLYFEFRMGTQWYCGEAKGDISYYIVPYLDSAGHLGAYLDAWSYNQSGGGPFCTGDVNDALNSSVPKGIELLQGIVSSAFSDLANARFSSVYVLPGNGTKDYGDTSENVDMDAAIAAIP